MRQHYCGLFVQPDEKSGSAICTNDLISVSLILVFSLSELRHNCKEYQVLITVIDKAVAVTLGAIMAGAL